MKKTVKRTIRRDTTYYGGLPDTKEYAVLKRDAFGQVCIYMWTRSKAEALVETEDCFPEDVKELTRKLNDCPVLNHNEAGKSFAIVS